MFRNIWSKIKGVLARMGIIKSIQELSDVPNLLVDEQEMSRITDWVNTYQGTPLWQNSHWLDVKGDVHTDRMMSLRMAKVSAKKMASLVFNQAATITAYPVGQETQPGKSTPKDNESKPNVVLQTILKENHFADTLERELEYMFGTGGLAARETVENGKVKISFATADAFVPISADSTGITECVIANSFTRGGRYYTLLEWHTETPSDYHVRNQLFRSVSTDGSDLGSEVPLSECYPGVKTDSDYSKKLYTRPTFQYVRPNIANNFSMNSSLGVPIYANAMDTLQMLDVTYNMLSDEMLTGKRRIVAPDSMLRGKINPATGQREWYVDWNEKVYQSFHDTGADSGLSKETIRDITLPLRNDTLIGTLNSLLKLYASQTGFSAGTFSYDAATGMQTATEVISQQSDTYQSKNSHETLVARFIQDIATSCLELAKNATSVPYNDTADVTVMVNFDDSIAKDRNDNAKYYQTMNGNKPLMPHIESIKRANGLDDQTAAEWAEQIEDEEPGEGDMNSILETNNGGDGDGS